MPHWGRTGPPFVPEESSLHPSVSFVVLTALTSPVPKPPAFDPSFCSRDPPRGCTAEGRPRARRWRRGDTYWQEGALGIRAAPGKHQGDTASQAVQRARRAPGPPAPPPAAQTAARPARLPGTGTPRARGWGRGRGGGRGGRGGRAGLPSSADFMVPRAGGAGPKVSPIPQTAAGGPSGNLEGTGKRVLGIHAAGRRRSGRGGRSGTGAAAPAGCPGGRPLPADARRPGLSAARPVEMSLGACVRGATGRGPGTQAGWRRWGSEGVPAPLSPRRRPDLAVTVPASSDSPSLALTQGRAAPPAFLKLENTSPASPPARPLPRPLPAVTSRPRPPEPARGPEDKSPSAAPPRARPPRARPAGRTGGCRGRTASSLAGMRASQGPLGSREGRRRRERALPKSLCKSAGFPRCGNLEKRFHWQARERKFPSR